MPSSEPVPEQVVLPDARAAAEDEARLILAEAQRRAQEILQQAKQEKETVLTQAYTDGKAAAEQEMAVTLQTAYQVVAQVDAWWQEMMQQSEPMVLELVKDIAGYMYGSGLIWKSRFWKPTLGRRCKKPAPWAI